MAVVATILLLVNLVLVWLLWSRSRRQRLRFVLPADFDAEGLLPSLAALTYSHVTEGNALQIHQNGLFFEALLSDIEGARDFIHFETFLWQDGEISNQVAAALARKAAEGVEVRLLVDARGSRETPPELWEALFAAGAAVVKYGRFSLRGAARYNSRDHRKLAVIDGRTAYLFGHGVADPWAGEPGDGNHWRDTAVRIEGPLVNEVQAAFMENWMESTGTTLIGRRYFPFQRKAGETAAHLAFVATGESSSAVQRLYYLAIAAARRELIIQNPYFLPDGQALSLFSDARRRGVSVWIMLPTSRTSDFPVVQHASHHFYRRLLQEGVRLFEYTTSGIHQKVIVVDGTWCALGSTNFDPRSFELNDEISVGIHDPAIAGQLREAFFEDLAHSEEWTEERWKRRGMRHRAVDAASALLKKQL